MKWKCALLQRWLPEYPDGDLSAFWRGRLKAHLAGCAVCRREQAALKSVVESIQAFPVVDPGPEFWSEFSREMHLKLVRAAQEGEMAPAAPWWSRWRRLPYLVGAPALAVLLLWVAVSYLTPKKPGLSPGQIAQQQGAAGQMATAPPPPASLTPEEGKNFVYVARNGSEGMLQEDELEDLDSTLAGMTEQEKEAFLKKLSQHKGDGTWLRRSSVYALA